MRGACQVADLTLMIRATRGSSMDGWMDGWMEGRKEGWMDGWRADGGRMESGWNGSGSEMV